MLRFPHEEMACALTLARRSVFSSIRHLKLNGNRFRFVVCIHFVIESEMYVKLLQLPYFLCYPNFI